MATSAESLTSVNCRCFNQLQQSAPIYIPVKSKALEQFTSFLPQGAMRSAAEMQPAEAST